MKKQVFIILIGISLFLVSFVHGENINNSNIFINMSWDKDSIISNKEFKINLYAYDLQDKKYDIKIYIYNSNKKYPITLTMDKDGNWDYSKYFINDFFKGSGNKSDYVKMAIAGEYRGYFGTGTIVFRIRENNSDDFISEIQKDIKILRPLEVNKSDVISFDTQPIVTKIDKTQLDNVQQNKTADEEPAITSNVVYIDSKNVKTSENAVNLQSKLIRYSVYIFIGLFVLFLILFLRLLKR